MTALGQLTRAKIGYGLFFVARRQSAGHAAFAQHFASLSVYAPVLCRRFMLRQ